MELPRYEAVLGGRYEWHWLGGKYTWIVTADEHAFLKQLLITPERVEEVKRIPQRTPAWLKERFGRLTASNFGSAAGHNKYCSPRELVKQNLWNTFQGNEATQWGSDREQVCCDIAELALRQRSPNQSVWVEHQGLWVVPQLPMFGLSVDGLIHVDGDVYLLEIKCPFRKNFYRPHIPHYYADQVQGIMGFLDVMGRPTSKAFFVTYIPGATKLEEFTFQRHYFYTELLPGLMKWYRELYLPALVLYNKGMLKQGEIDLTYEFMLNEQGKLVEEVVPGDPPRPIPSSTLEEDLETERVQAEKEAEVTEQLHEENKDYYSTVEDETDFIMSLLMKT